MLDWKDSQGFSSVRKIYRALQDDESRMIFTHRLLYSLTGDENQMVCMLQTLHKQYGICPQTLLPEKYCVYGAGNTAQNIRILGRLTNRNPTFYIDKCKTGEIDGVPVLSLDRFCAMSNYESYMIVLAVGGAYEDEVCDNLQQHGIRDYRNYRELIRSDFGREQYFDLPQMNLSTCESFVDAGCYNGADTVAFLRHCPDGTVYAFEPNPSQYAICKKNLARISNTRLYPYGIYNRTTILNFEQHNKDNPTRSDGNGKISGLGNIKIEAVALDDVLKNEQISFIKMDIEGAELAALHGCKQIIEAQKPKLAISVYHKPEDIFEIPDYILTLNSNYQLYLRHYCAFSAYETVLYAV